MTDQRTIGDDPGAGADDQRMVDLLERVWSSIGEVCAGLGPQEWDLPTDCPGWSVKDNVSHLNGIESRLLGRPAPDHKPADLSHVRNPLGEANEAEVDYRRPWSPEKVLDEFREVTAERLKTMRSWGAEEFEKESWTPIGPGKVRDFLGIRVFDSWVHEQDIRRAAGRPGGLDGPVARHAFGSLSTAMPFVVGKKVAPPDGTTVVFDVEGTGTVGVGVEGGRGKALDRIPGEPTVRLKLDLESFNVLGCGRRTAAQVLGEGRVAIEGDEALAQKVLEQMTFMI